MEFRFELALCAALESPDRVVARQLGAGIENPGGRIVDVCVLTPGPGFDRRAAITPDRIPDPAIEAAVGPGEAVPLKKAFDLPPDRAEAVAERAAEVGYLERERRDGRPIVRATARYPDDWVGSLTAIENKPDLGTPGDLAAQLRYDAALGLFDEVVLATASYVTRAHLNRIPEAVGVWRSIPTRASARSFGSRRPSNPTRPASRFGRNARSRRMWRSSTPPRRRESAAGSPSAPTGRDGARIPRAARTRRRLLTGARTAIGSIGSSIPGATAVRPVARTSLRIPPQPTGAPSVTSGPRGWPIPPVTVRVGSRASRGSCSRCRRSLWESLYPERRTLGYGRDR